MNKRRILVVEDERLVARHIETMVLGLGYDVVGAVSTGEDAVRVALETLPDLVLMDVAMPDLSGFEATAWDDISSVESGGKPYQKAPGLVQIFRPDDKKRVAVAPNVQLYSLQSRKTRFCRRPLRLAMV